MVRTGALRRVTPVFYARHVNRSELNTDAQASDEDRLELPEAWTGFTLDRRGRGTPRPAVIDAQAPERIRAAVAESGDGLERLIGMVRSPEYVALIRAGLAGEPDPLGAALALAALARFRRGEATIATGVEAWIAGHGAVFATRAAMEFMGRMLLGYDRGDGHWTPVKIEPADVHHLMHEDEFVGPLAPLRSLLAAMPEAEYAEAVAAVDARRDTDGRRFAAAMLMPEQEAWVAEACRLHGEERYRAAGRDAIWSVVSTREHLALSGVRLVEPHNCGAPRIARLVDALGVDALPVLIATLKHWKKPNAKLRKLIFEAMERMPSDEAIARLFQDPSDALAMKSAMRAAQRFPARSLRAVAAKVPGADDALRTRLEGIVRSRPALLGAAGGLDAQQRAAIDRLLGDADTTADAPAAAVPAVFTEPPWSKPRTPPTVPGLAPPEVNELRWTAEELEYPPSDGTELERWRIDMWRRHLEKLRTGRHAKYTELLAHAPMDIAEPEFATWDGTTTATSAWELERILKRFGEPAVQRVLAIVKARPSCRRALTPILNLEAARLAADSLASRSTRSAATAWLDRHGADAVALLIPDALGEAPEPRLAAAAALRHLAEPDPEHVRRPAAAYGERAAAAVDELLRVDPLDPQVAKIPRPGTWADPAVLPPVLLEDDRKALPREAVRTLMTALALDDPFRPYAGTDLLIAECDPASLLRFSWALFELWRSSGAPAKDAWAMHQVARFADEETVRRLAELVSDLSDRGQRRRAAEGVELLCAIGSDQALRAVQHFAQRSRSKPLEKVAAEELNAAARRLGLGARGLADRLVPDFGLGDESASVLDYGPRRFTVEFDGQSRLCVVDGSGKRRAGPPRPGADDDPDRARAAYERFTALRRELKAVLAEQVKRLEKGMVERRAWTGAEFRRYLVDHPVMRHLSSRLVWQAETAGRRTSFRIAEDRTFADLDDRELRVPDDALVRVPHPVELGEELDRWARTLADYEVLQPFEQLARPVLAFTEAERRTGRLARFEGAVVKAGALLGLLARGWDYGGVSGSASDCGVSFRFPGGAGVLLDSDPGFHPRDRSRQSDQRLHTVQLILREGDADVDPVLASEVLGTLTRLTAGA
jgi:hypothetical protein